jgi:CheY-like chemotaxis protein
MRQGPTQYKIFVVDDEPMIVETMEAILRRQGFDATYSVIQPRHWKRHESCCPIC